jgi:hypothetical protein
MKKLQNQFLFRFIVLITIWNVLFRVALSYMLKNEIFNMVIVPPVIFFLLMFFTGKYFGLKQWKDLPTDVSFKYHLSSFCIFFIVSYGFYFSDLLSKYEPRLILDYILIFWGLCLIFHFIQYIKFKKSSIKGIHHDQIFD